MYEVFKLSILTKGSFLTFGKPDIGLKEEMAVLDVLRSGWLGTGKVTREFEEEFVKYMGGGYAIAVSSCTIGLVIALRSVGLCHGENVLTTPLTFCATVNAILQIGAVPLFCDVDDNGLIDHKLVKSYEKSSDAILAVNYTGEPARIKSNLIPVIEDAAHSFGGECGYGDLTVFSFYPTKNITSGEGGMIWTKDRNLADKCRLFSNHGQSSGAWGRYSSGPMENYKIIHPGYKGNMPDILAAIGLAQLRRWPELREKRERIWEIYEKAFGAEGKGHSHHLYTIYIKDRARIREDLYNKGIGTGIHYEALHLQPAYKYLGYRKGDFPIAEQIGEETLSLPVSSTMTEEDAKRVVRCVKEVL